MSKFIHKAHNVSVIMYHIVCPAKYRRVVFDNKVDQELKKICAEIENRYEIFFIEIGCDQDHVHFLVQSIPTLSPTQIVRTIKSITAREIFKRIPEVKKILWGGQFWSKGYFISTVGLHSNEEAIKSYVKNQGNEKNYKQIYRKNIISTDLLPGFF
jgi:putative transposase